MARPTAASAAATTMTKKTKICPLTWCQWLGKCNECQVHAIQHQLNRHENGDDVALDQENKNTPIEKSAALSTR